MKFMAHIKFLGNNIIKNSLSKEKKLIIKIMINKLIPLMQRRLNVAYRSL